MYAVHPIAQVADVVIPRVDGLAQSGGVRFLLLEGLAEIFDSDTLSYEQVFLCIYLQGDLCKVCPECQEVGRRC